MRPIVRLYETRDLDAVIVLSLRAWAPIFDSLENILGGIYHRLHSDWRADQRRAVRATCTAAGMRVWVAELNEGVIGFVAARLDHETDIGEIYMIAVDPEYQRNGAGALLTSTALRWFKDSNMTVAMVETGGDPGHAPARRTYERAGFVALPIARYFKTL
ncbi:MAG TPA: GNAT family N-acetyltransferase [Streptosporangiaceae bacterium]|jgi:ribosomal protein S18 acetylase RimI-like enzyme